jgi:glycosyltransferase involved in cell wall biosynthesis
MTFNGSTPNDRASLTAPFSLSDNGRNIAAGQLEIDPQPRWDGADVPLVSCLMVTSDRPRLAERAIECFIAQSYPNRELVVIDGSDSDQLQQGVEAIRIRKIKLQRVRPAGRSMGELRNLAVQKAAGQYVCIWDDDDLYDPDRLSVQMSAITTLGADACFLARLQLWWPARHILAFSFRRTWEGSMICAKDKMPRYPALHRGEDPPVAYRLWRSQRVVMLDEPRLYTYVFHGGNTTGAAQFAQHCAAATQQWTGAAYADRLADLGTRVPIDTEEPGSVQYEDNASPAFANGSDRRADE